MIVDFRLYFVFPFRYATDLSVFKGLVEVGDNIVGILDAHAEPYARGTDTRRYELIGGKLAMRA